ncbi:MAG: hypothetical protein JXB30_09195 [Anaerolineae bacterium]|nr:hypothetical protein [Anaerolineae bacterium]
MTYSIVDKYQNRILLITVSDPFDFGTEPAQIRRELHTILGDITHTIYLIYDMKCLTVGFSDLISEAATLNQPQNEFEEQLQKHGRMILIGSGTPITITAKTVAQLIPHKPIHVFETPEEALEHAHAELAKQD